MISLAPYVHSPSRLEDYLPWGMLVAPGIVLNKDGSFQRSARFRGPDVRSSTAEELAGLSLRINNVFRRLGQGWAIYVEAERRTTRAYPNGAFEDDLSRLVDAERAEAFEAAEAHFESLHTLTLQWTPPPDSRRKAEAFFFDNRAGNRGTRSKPRTDAHNASQATRKHDGPATVGDAGCARQALDDFQCQSDWAFSLFETLTHEFSALDDGQTLSYLKSTISTRRDDVAMPASGAFLDGLLCDMPLVGGAKPMLGERHLRTLTLKGFPPATSPGILDDLNALGIEFRWMTRFICLGREEANRELTKWRRLWFSRHKSLAALLKETLTRESSTFSDPDAIAKTAEADAAIEDLGGGAIGFGYLTTTLSVTGASAAEADERLQAADRVMSARGFVTIPETLNAVEAWLSSLPGQAYANVRRPMVSTLNFSHVAPLASTWAGPLSNRHLNAPPLAVTLTDGSTPFRLDLHVGDVGHTLIVGPTGAGKSVLLAFLCLQWRRYEDAQVFVFDKGGSARAAIRGMGGEALDLGASQTPAFQPLADIDEPIALARAMEWVCGIVAQEGVELTPHKRDALWSALRALATSPVAQRHLTGLRLLVQDGDLKSALSPYTQDGAHGRLFDASESRLNLQSCCLFEMEALMDQPKAAGPALTYLFNQLEARFDGRPTLLILDEAWAFLDSPQFATRIREWLKTLRKKNVAVVFATQSLADIAGASIASALIESCPTRIFLPNERAFEPQQKLAYESFGLNDTEITLIATATRKRDYYYSSPLGRRVFDLALGPIALGVCAASDPKTRALISGLETERSREPFWRRFLEARRLGWVLDALDATAPSHPVAAHSPEASADPVEKDLQTLEAAQ